VSGFEGLDPAEVRALAWQLRAESDDLASVVAQADRQLQQVPWTGADRDHFLGDWGVHRTAVQHLVQALSVASTAAAEHADMQERASYGY
jgi:hypothetical protein